MLTDLQNSSYDTLSSKFLTKPPHLKCVAALLCEMLMSKNCNNVKHIIWLIIHHKMPSVLWHCWLGIRKSIRPVRNLSDEVLAWLSVWSEMQRICI